MLSDVSFFFRKYLYLSFQYTRFSNVNKLGYSGHVDTSGWSLNWFFGKLLYEIASSVID